MYKWERRNTNGKGKEQVSKEKYKQEKEVQVEKGKSKGKRRYNNIKGKIQGEKEMYEKWERISPSTKERYKWERKCRKCSGKGEVLMGKGKSKWEKRCFSGTIVFLLLWNRLFRSVRSRERTIVPRNDAQPCWE